MCWLGEPRAVQVASGLIADKAVTILVSALKFEGSALISNGILLEHGYNNLFIDEVLIDENECLINQTRNFREGKLELQGFRLV